jgi:hypothetical protein
MRGFSLASERLRGIKLFAAVDDYLKAKKATANTQRATEGSVPTLVEKQNGVTSC